MNASIKARHRAGRPPRPRARPLDSDELASVAGGAETVSTARGGGFFQVREEGG